MPVHISLKPFTKWKFNSHVKTCCFYVIHVTVNEISIISDRKRKWFGDHGKLSVLSNMFIDKTITTLFLDDKQQLLTQTLLLAL